MAATGKRQLKFSFEGDAAGLLKLLKQVGGGIDDLNKKSAKANSLFGDMKKSLDALKRHDWYKASVWGMQQLLKFGNKLIGVYRGIRDEAVGLYRNEQMTLRQRQSILQDRPGLKVGAGFQKKVNRFTQGQGRFRKGDVDAAANTALTFARSENEALRLVQGAINTAAAQGSSPNEVMRQFKAAAEGQGVEALGNFGLDTRGLRDQQEAIRARRAQLTGAPKGVLGTQQSARMQAEAAALDEAEPTLGRGAVEQVMRRNAGAANVGDDRSGRLRNVLAPGATVVGGIFEKATEPYYDRMLTAAGGINKTLETGDKGKIIAGGAELLASGQLAKIFVDTFRDSQVVETIKGLFGHGAGVIIEALKLGMESALDLAAERTGLVSKREKPSESQVYRDVFLQSGDAQAELRNFTAEKRKEIQAKYKGSWLGNGRLGGYDARISRETRQAVEEYQEARGRTMAQAQGLNVDDLAEMNRTKGLRRELAGFAEAVVSVPTATADLAARGLEATNVALAQAAKGSSDTEMMLRQQTLAGAPGQI